MPVTKRTRYEVLKRDNHTCRYCGASAPDATLTVDHIACGNDRVRADETFRYFAGCVWRVVKDMQDGAKELLDAEEVSPDGA